MPNYMPAADATLQSWMLNFSTLLTASPSTYGLTAPDAVIVETAEQAFSDSLVISSDPGTRTPVTVAAKDAARASAEAVMRPYAVQISLNPAVTNGNKVAIGVTVRTNTPTPIPAPVVAPVIQLVQANPLVHQLQIVPTGASNKAKPAGTIAIEIARTVGTMPATDPLQLAIIGQYGKTPLIQGFSAEDQGKICTYAARYRTRSGPAGVSQAGPWSNLVNFIVM